MYIKHYVDKNSKNSYILNKQSFSSLEIQSYCIVQPTIHIF